MRENLSLKFLMNMRGKRYLVKIWFTQRCLLELTHFELPTRTADATDGNTMQFEFARRERCVEEYAKHFPYYSRSRMQDFFNSATLTKIDFLCFSR